MSGSSMLAALAAVVPVSSSPLSSCCSDASCARTGAPGERWLRPRRVGRRRTREHGRRGGARGPRRLLDVRERRRAPAPAQPPGPRARHVRDVPAGLFAPTASPRSVPRRPPLVLACRADVTEGAECLYRPPGTEPTWFSISAASAGRLCGGACRRRRHVPDGHARPKARSRCSTPTPGCRPPVEEELRHPQRRDGAASGELSQLPRLRQRRRCAFGAQFSRTCSPGGSGAIFLVATDATRATPHRRMGA